MQTRLRISYRRSVRNSPDAYKRLATLYANWQTLTIYVCITLHSNCQLNVQIGILLELMFVLYCNRWIASTAIFDGKQCIKCTHLRAVPNSRPMIALHTSTFHQRWWSMTWVQSICWLAFSISLKQAYVVYMCFRFI